MKLSDLKVKQKAIILKVSADRKIRIRLLRLGFSENSECEIVKYSPFKKNMLLKIKSNLIGIRLSLAENITVKKL